MVRFVIDNGCICSFLANKANTSPTQPQIIGKAWTIHRQDITNKSPVHWPHVDNKSPTHHQHFAKHRQHTTNPQPTHCHYNASTGHYPQFGQYKIGLSGVDGPCAHFTPPAGIWCQTHPDAGRTFEVPTSVTYSASSSGLSSDGASWTAQNAPVVLHAFQGSGWGSWTFSAQARVDGDNVTFEFTAGGNQEARGSATGGPSYVDNAKVELVRRTAHNFACLCTVIWSCWLQATVYCTADF